MKTRLKGSFFPASGYESHQTPRFGGVFVAPSNLSKIRKDTAAENQARTAKRGLWAAHSPVASWEWRRNKTR